MEISFIDKCITGESLPAEIDDYVDLWHDGKAGHHLELYEFLGMTWDEYSLWAARPSILPAIITARKKGNSLTDILNIPGAGETQRTPSFPAALSELCRPFPNQGVQGGSREKEYAIPLTEGELIKNVE